MNCYICGGKSKQLFLNKQKLGLKKCADCGVYFTHPRADKSVIKSFYDKKDYFKHWFEYTDIKKITDNMRVQKITELTKAPAKLLDFGCGPGFFIKAAISAGYNVNGIEYSDFAVEYCKQNSLKVEHFNNLPLNFPNNNFDIITVWHTLEHLETPREIINELYRILKPNGIIVIEVPNYYGLLSLLRGKKALPLTEHLFHFTEKSLNFLLSDAGFKILEIMPGNPGYTRTGVKILIKKILAFSGKAIHKLFKVNCADTIYLTAIK